MKHNEPIKKYMSAELVSITKDTKLSEARRIFLEKDIHHLPVVEGDAQLVGILSYNDLLRVDSGTLYQQDPKQADALIDNMSSVTDAMTKELTTLTASQTVRDATTVLSAGDFHSLPVVDDNTIVGIVTSTDLLKYFLDQY